MKIAKSKYLFPLLAFICFVVMCGSVWAQTTGTGSAYTQGKLLSPAPPLSPRAIPIAGQVPSSQQMTPQQADAYQNLSPAQQQAVQQELGRSGGQLTPQAIEALKGRSEFKGLSPEDVLKGKQLLEQKETKTPDRATVQKRAVIGEEPREKSLFDRFRQAGRYQDVSLDLKLFGQEFFRDAAVQVLTERTDVPVPLKYVIGPGDEVRLLLWGRVNAQHNLVVDRDGKITVPQLGPMFVAGMTFEDMSKYLIQQSGQIVGTNMDISMGALKTIPIFILGDVRRPGSYTIGAFSTVSDALLIAGGPSQIGSMRNVQLKRKNMLVTTFDLYDLLLKGDKSKDVILHAGDVVFVPVAGQVVGITGNVKRPAIYELKDKHDLQTLIDFAGGIIPTAYTQQIQVERVVRNERQIIVDINDKNMDRAVSFPLQDADLVKIFSIVDMDTNVVYLNGNVKRPGKYEYKPVMKVSSIIKGAADILPDTYFDYVLIKRLNPPSMEPLLIPVNLGKLLLQGDAASDMELRPADQIFVFNKWFFEDRHAVTVEGEIRGNCNVFGEKEDEALLMARKPGWLTAYQERETYIRKGEQTGSLAASTDKAREGRDRGDYRDDDQKVKWLAASRELKTIENDLRKTNNYDLADTVNKINDEIIRLHWVSSKDFQDLNRELGLVGRQDLADRIRDIENGLKNFCRVEISPQTRIRDVILNAGGLNNNAYLQRGEIIRTGESKQMRTIYFDLARVMAGDDKENIPVQNLDRVVIHSIWEQTQRDTVAVDGEISKPGSYQFTQDMTVKDLIFKAGNVVQSSYLDQAEITSMVVDEKKGVSFAVRNINLRKALAADPEQNLKLKPFDRLLIKRIPDWREVMFVRLTGEVKFPGRYQVKQGEKLSSLIQRAGGYTDLAYMRGAIFKRERVRQIQQEGLEDMAKRLERDALAQGTSQVSSSRSVEEVQAKQAEMVSRQKFIETLKNLKATGRMTIRLANTRLLKGSEFDIDMEDGDSLYVPQKNSVVNVMGSVMAQATYIYQEKFTYEDYISMAGGYSSYANPDDTFVLKVDGSARRLDSGFFAYSDKRSRWEMTAFGEEIKIIEPGDVIVVPEKFGKIAWLREIRDITQILMNTAVVAGVVIKLF